MDETHHRLRSQGPVRHPRKRWVPLAKGLYRVLWNGTEWNLRATPERPFPWLLYDRAGTSQEIGVEDVSMAQGMSEVWLELSDRYGGTGRGRRG